MDYALKSFRRRLVGLLLFAFGGLLFAQTIMMNDRQFIWTLDMQCIAQKLINAYGHYLPGSFLNDENEHSRQLSINATMAHNNRGTLMADTFTAIDGFHIFPSASVSTDGASAGLGIGLTHSTATVQFDSNTQAAMFVVKDGEGHLYPLQVGTIMPNGLFAPAGSGIDCLQLRNEIVNPVPVPAPSVAPQASYDIPTERPNWHIVPESYSYDMTYMLWMGVDQPVQVLSTTVTVRYYTLVPDGGSEC